VIAAMGLIHLGIPKDLIAELSRAFGVTYFVETGTHHGWSALWASGHFEKVWTVELDEALFRRASRRLANRANVEQHLGPSVGMLRSVVPLLDRPAFFWLDAHWSGEDTGGEAYPCPLQDEIEEINASPLEHIIAVDDVRFCLNAKPPFGRGRWPEIGTLAELLRARHSDSYLAIHYDIAFRLPASCAARFEEIVARPYRRESLSRRLKRALGWRRRQ
jgi:hypothetical protein